MIQNARSAVSNFGDILSLDCRWGLSIAAIWLPALQHQIAGFKKVATPLGPNQITVVHRHIYYLYLLLLTIVD